MSGDEYGYDGWDQDPDDLEESAYDPEDDDESYSDEDDDYGDDG